ncbi:Sel1 domain-containing protein [methanogenic archaeon mixed culture ISO4-G1]|nr:Sel1 domain-containing protein [methanogenic archaeon mixed culture ISO4-G1]
MLLNRITMEDLREQVNALDPEATYIMGNKLMNGFSAPMDTELGKGYIFTSAALGFARAQVAAGELILSGAADEKNSEKAVEYFRKAAEQGCPEGIWKLGECLMEGRGIESDYELGFSLMISAAKRGCVPAMLEVGEICIRDRNGKRAEKYLKRAASKGNEEAKFELANLYSRAIWSRRTWSGPSDCSGKPLKEMWMKR